ncbi:MAG: M23 family metallopeptidase [Pararobbsia sp.]
MWVWTRDFFGFAAATLLAYGAVAMAGQLGGGTRMVRVAAPPVEAVSMSSPLGNGPSLPAAQFVNQTAIKASDTPDTLLKRLAVADPAAIHFLTRHPAARTVFTAPPGIEVRATVDHQQQLQSLSATLPLSVGGDAQRARRMSITRAGERFTVSYDTVRSELAVQLRSVRVGAGLGLSLRKAGVPAAIALEFARQIEGRVDLRRDIGPDDRCSLVYERFDREGAAVGHGRLLAAELTTRRGPLRMVWYTGDATLPAAFYEPSGKPWNASHAMFIEPLAHASVTSSFGMRRHPLSGSREAHTGVDLAAPRGTPVSAAADGIVEFAGWRSGYGNLVVLRHAGNYRTYYAHLSSFAPGLRGVAAIQQGGMVGRVGSTGWATGAHLHFEVRHDNQPIDPLRLASLARAAPREAQLRTFRRQTEPWMSKIALMREPGAPMIDS